MIARASGFLMGVDRFSRPLRGVAVLAVPDAVLDTTRPVESVSMVPLGASVLRLVAPGVVVGIIFDPRWVADGVEVTC